MSLLSEQPTAAGLAARLRDASEVTAELMAEFIGIACRFPSVGQTKKTARIERLIGNGAWTDAALAAPRSGTAAVAALTASPMNRANGTARFRASANCRTGSINSIEGRHADRQMLPDAILARYGKPLSGP